MQKEPILYVLTGFLCMKEHFQLDRSEGDFLNIFSPLVKLSMEKTMVA